MGKCYASAVLAVAVGEIGYLEKKTNSQLDNPTANAGSNNWTKYANFFDKECPNWYNGKKNGYAWCDMFVDYCFHKAFGHEDALRLLCQPEKSAGAGCTYSLMYYRNKGQFHTSGPKPGDQIFFGTSTSSVSHTGIVEKVVGSTVHTIEGNTSDKVARRTYALTNSTIVGYGRPAYDAETGGNTGEASQPTPSTDGAVWPSVGDVVTFTGTKHYASSNATNGKTCKPGKATVTSLAKSGRHPVHLIWTAGGGSNVYGWVDIADIKVEGSAAIVKGSTVKLRSGAKTYTGGGLAAFVYSRTYTVMQVDKDRVVIGINGVVTAAVNIKDLTLC